MSTPCTVVPAIAPASVRRRPGCHRTHSPPYHVSFPYFTFVSRHHHHHRLRAGGHARSGRRRLRKGEGFLPPARRLSGHRLQARPRQPGAAGQHLDHHPGNDAIPRSTYRRRSRRSVSRHDRRHAIRLHPQLFHTRFRRQQCHHPARRHPPEHRLPVVTHHRFVPARSGRGPEGTIVPDVRRRRRGRCDQLRLEITGPHLPRRSIHQHRPVGQLSCGCGRGRSAGGQSPRLPGGRQPELHRRLSGPESAGLFWFLRRSFLAADLPAHPHRLHHVAGGLGRKLLRKSGDLRRGRQHHDRQRPAGSAQLRQRHRPDDQPSGRSSVTEDQLQYSRQLR